MVRRQDLKQLLKQLLKLLQLILQPIQSNFRFIQLQLQLTPIYLKVLQLLHDYLLLKLLQSFPQFKQLLLIFILQSLQPPI